MTKGVGCRDMGEEKPSLEDLAKPLVDAVEAITETVGVERARAAFLINRLLLDGDPVSPKQIASNLQISGDELTIFLRQIGVEFDQEGNAVGFGVSLTPTPHRYEFNGRKLYVWCAADAVIFPARYGHTAVIESPDPVTGAKIRLTVTPERVERAEPSSAVVSWMRGPSWDPWNTRSTGCAFGHFFTSPETATKYASEHPGVVILSLDEVYQVAKLVIESEPFKRLDAQ